MATTTASSVPPPPPPAALAQVLPYITAGFSFVFTSSIRLFRLSWALSTTALHLTASLVTHMHLIQHIPPIQLLLYLLAPLLVFIQLGLEVFAYTPWRVMTYTADAVYPAYVFLGVACIAGAVMGLSGRMVVLGTLSVLEFGEERKARRVLVAREGEEEFEMKPLKMS